MNEHTVTHSYAGFVSTQFSRRSSRRTLVGAWLLSCLGFVTLAVFQLLGVIWFAMFAFAFAADVALYLATHQVAERPTSALDERQRAVRNDAYRGAYRIVLALVALSVGGAMLCFSTGVLLVPQWFSQPARHPAVLTGFGVLALQLVCLLPTAIIAWNEQDEPGEFD